MTHQSQYAQLLAWLQRMIVLRLVVVTVLLGTTVYVYVDGDGDSLGQTLTLLWILIGASYLQSAIFFLFERFGTSRQLRSAGKRQIIFDVFLSTGLVYITGGVSSLFTALYCVTICYTACAFGKQNGHLVAGVSGAAFALLVMLEYNGVLPSILYGEDGSHGYTTLRILGTICFNLLLFNVVALVIGGIVEKLRTTEQSLIKGQRKLEELDDLNQRILESITSAVVTVDRMGKIIHFNRAAENILGVQEGQVLGRPISDYLSDAQVKIDELNGQGESSFSKLLPWTINYSGKNGTNRTLSASLSNLRGEGYILAIQDVTRLREMEDMVKRSERLAAVGRLSAAIAHEVRNPLASISGSIQMLRAESHEPQNQRLMDIALRETDRLNALIRDFLEYARPAPPEISTVELEEVIDETVTLFDSGATDIDIQVLHGGSFMVRADSAQLKQVFWNLLTNAQHASGSRGKIEVATEFNQKSKMVAIRVRDFGCGIADEDRAKIFDPFFTTRKEGNGLGLPTVAKIIEAHGGNIGFDNQPGGGACFTIELQGQPTA